VRRADQIKQGTDAIGNVTNAKVVKNKLAPPFKKAEFDIIFGKGISSEGNVLDLAVLNKLVNKAGSWFTLGDEKLGQGRENARQFLVDNPDTMRQLELEIRRIHGLAPLAAEAAA
jgi:recombination protein RecA